MDNALRRLYKTKLALLATGSTVVGIALLMLSHWLSPRPSWAWFAGLVNDVGASLFSIGLLGVFFQYIGAADQEQADDDRVRRMLKETAPDTVDLGEQVVAEHHAVTVAYTYRTLVRQRGHLLHLDISQPTKGLHVDFSYKDCGIAHVNVLDYIAGAQQPQIRQLPADDPTPSVEIGYDGWVFPKGGVAFVWVLASETATPSGRKVVRPSSSRALLSH